VLRRFLGSINPDTQWLLDLPGIFVDVVELGHAFAAHKPHHGVSFFEVFGQGGLGNTPERVREALTHARRLREIDPELAVAFLRGYRRLTERLSAPEVGLYVDAGLAAFVRNRRAGLAFMEGLLESAEATIQAITKEARLGDVSAGLSRLVRALTGTEVEVDDIGKLDSDDLIERGCMCVCMYQWLYLPSRVRRFEDRGLNRGHYRLSAVVASAALAFDSFSRLHGHPDFPTCEALVGTTPLALNAFLIVEWRRVFRRLRSSWPGAARLLALGLRADAEYRPAGNAADRLFLGLESGTVPEDLQAAAALLEPVSRASVNVFDTARRLTSDLLEALRREVPGLAREVMRPFSFMPDYLFPGRVSSPPSDNLVADLKRQADAASDAADDGDPDAAAAAEPVGGGEHADGDEEEQKSALACYLYDEWSHDENDYYRDYCFLHETRPEPPPGVIIPTDVADEGRRVSQVFERLKPDLARKEKYLQEGDAINPDLLVNYLVQRRKDPSPRIDFYEKPRIRRRDLAVIVLLDASGSTGERTGGHERIIDVEKRAALILGQGLNTLGDRFAICGFSSNGRENCVFSVYKDFDDGWSTDTMKRIMAASPANSTRIGPALRHCGFRMSRLDARQRLVILITDGRPMDTGYDPNTRYAQHDVRMACDENEQEGVHTFAISTEENSVADMEIMFPGRRFAILSDIGDLPTVLPRLYTRLTL
jgi:hypothetical protein